ncbi:hypothetical protein [Cryobacterium sp. GrIS_2_6]|uniref:hypothetical protein n=1 Tax=Cryobacterium sp. GrIS_2_6 TaxID=3162785 RepID=UPI002E05CF97|nr:hypothetical protein [Cryobacterium psychrotolerans]
MSQELIIGVITAVAVVFAAGISTPRLLRDIRTTIAKDIDIYNALPDASTAKAALLARIDVQIGELDTHDKARSQPIGIGLGISFLVIGGALLWLLILQGGLWWWASPIVLTILVFGLAGLIISSQKVLRDEKGNPIKAVKK